MKKGSDKIWVTKTDNRVIVTPDVSNPVDKNVGFEDDEGGLPLVNSSNALFEQGTSAHSREEVLSMPNLIEIDEYGTAHICKNDVVGVETSSLVSSLSPISSREKERRRSLENFEKYLQDSEVEPFTPKVRNAALSAPIRMRPIALCARSEDSPARRALNVDPNLKLVPKDHSAAAAVMHIAATREFTRLNSMKQP